MTVILTRIWAKNSTREVYLACVIFPQIIHLGPHLNVFHRPIVNLIRVRAHARACIFPARSAGLALAPEARVKQIIGPEAQWFAYWNRGPGGPRFQESIRSSRRLDRMRYIWIGPEAQFKYERKTEGFPSFCEAKCKLFCEAKQKKTNKNKIYLSAGGRLFKEKVLFAKQITKGRRPARTCVKNKKKKKRRKKTSKERREEKEENADDFGPGRRWKWRAEEAEMEGDDLKWRHEKRCRPGLNVVVARALKWCDSSKYSGGRYIKCEAKESGEACKSSI